MKNLLGLLHVAGLFVFYALVIFVLIVFIVSFYLLMGACLLLVMIKSYLLLGNPWFYIVWVPLLAGYTAFKTRKWWIKKLRRLP